MRAAALALAAALLLPGPARAGRSLVPPAAEFLPEAAWLNSKPLTLERLRGRRVVLVAFLSTANINSIRAIGVLKAWHDRYELNGLLVVGVHTPEFDFQKDPKLVHAEIKRYGIRFPVMLDNERRYWRAMGNTGWPAFFLINHKGRVVFDHLGEGAYPEFESEIQAALNRAEYRFPETIAKVKDPPNVGCGGMSGEISLGSRKGRTLTTEGAAAKRNFLLSVRDGETSTTGRWETEPDSLRLNQNNDDLTASLRVIYHGAQVFSVLAPAGGPGRFYVRQDDMWLHSGNAGKDVEFDDDGRSYVEAAHPGLYNLARNPIDATHMLALIPAKSGHEVYGYSFSDRCLTTDLP